MLKYRQLLEAISDAKLEALKKKHANISTEHDPFAEHKHVGNIINHFAEHGDPSDNKQHTSWIMDQYKKGNIRQEDAPRIHETLKNFQKHKHKLSQKDLNQYGHIGDLEKSLEPHLGQKSKREEVKEIKHEGAEKIHDENGVTVHHLKTKEAACKYGAETKWCTAAKKDNMFYRYNKEGKIYHVKSRDENGKMAKYQFHHETKQYMDAEDRPVDVKKLVKRNPELKNVKEFQGKHPSLTNDENFEKHFHHLLRSHPEATLSDERIKSRHLDKAINDEDADVRATAAGHPNATKEHLDKALNDEHSYVRSAAARNPNATKEHLDKALNDEHSYVRATAAGNRNASKEHLDKALNDEHPAVREKAASHPNANKEHLDKALNDKYPNVRSAAARNHNATKEHLDKAINDEDADVRAEAAVHPNATEEHLDKALNDKYSHVRSAAAGHPNATKEHLDKALNDEQPDVRAEATRHPNATKEHLDKALNDKYMHIRNIAKKRLKTINK